MNYRKPIKHTFKLLIFPLLLLNSCGGDNEEKKSQNEKGSSGSPFFMWLILIIVGISILYGIVRPDYEYYPVDGSCDEERNGILGDKVISEDYDCKEECLVFEKWLFTDNISGEIMAAARENEHGVNLNATAINFEGRIEDGFLVLELDSIGTIWNNGSTLKVKIVGDTLLQFRGRELAGGRSWFNFPGIY